MELPGDYLVKSTAISFAFTDPASTANTANSTDDSFIEQISFNQSHDRDPFVTTDGEIIYSRWDHVGGRNHFPVFKASLDGTDLFVLYGAFSPGNSRLYPREMPLDKA